MPDLIQSAAKRSHCNAVTASNQQQQQRQQQQQQQRQARMIRGVRAAVITAVGMVCWILIAGPAQSQDGRAKGSRIRPNSGPVQVRPIDADAAADRAQRQADDAIEQSVSRIDDIANADDSETPPAGWAGLARPEQLVTPGGLSSTLNLMLMLTVLSLAPSILIMTTCFIRFIVVFGLLRQALGTQQLPPNQVIIGLCLFMTFLIMAPVWQQSYDYGIRPYVSPAPGEKPVSPQETFSRTVLPLRRFMSEQIHRTGNGETVLMLLDYQRPDPSTPAGRDYRPPENYDQVPLSVLLPAFMLSELKTSFIIGFQLYLPFLVIDMVVAVVLMSMGMMMLPPTLFSGPFKLLLFVLIDGWYLTVGMLLESVRMTGG